MCHIYKCIGECIHQTADRYTMFGGKYYPIHHSRAFLVTVCNKITHPSHPRHNPMDLSYSMIIKLHSTINVVFHNILLTIRYCTMQPILLTNVHTIPSYIMDITMPLMFFSYTMNISIQFRSEHRPNL